VTAAGQDTVILGLGNPIMGDDRIGLEVADRVYRRLKSKALDLTLVLDAGNGLDFADAITGRQRAFVLDAVLGEGVGHLEAHHWDRMPMTRRISHSHAVGLVDGLAMARRLGMPLPEAIVVFGITIETAGFGTQLTPKMRAALPGLVMEIERRILAEIEHDEMIM